MENTAHNHLRRPILINTPRNKIFLGGLIHRNWDSGGGAVSSGFERLNSRYKKILNLLEVKNIFEVIRK